jgi:hypothetical protein
MSVIDRAGEATCSQGGVGLLCNWPAVGFRPELGSKVTTLLSSSEKREWLARR